MTTFAERLKQHSKTIDCAHCGGVATYRASVTDGNGRYFCCRTCCSRASESQRDGGFAVGQRVVYQAGIPWAGTIISLHLEADPPCAIVDWGSYGITDAWLRNLEPADPAPAQPDSYEAAVEAAELAIVQSVASQILATEPTRPPQPAPMTRAARVLAGLERDPYLQSRIDCSGINGSLPKDRMARLFTDQEPRNEAARLRMARMSLDRPLDAEQARWERLVTARVPVGRR